MRFLMKAKKLQCRVQRDGDGYVGIFPNGTRAPARDIGQAKKSCRLFLRRYGIGERDASRLIEICA